MKGPKDNRVRPVFITYKNKRKLALSDGKGNIYLPKSENFYEAILENYQDLKPLDPKLYEFDRGLTGFDY